MIKKSLISAASFSPKSLQLPNAWVGHLPFAAWAISEIEPNIFVELGTHTGNSYFAFCQSIAENDIPSKCYAIDTWQGDEHAGHYNDDIFEKINYYNNKNYSEFSQLLRMTFDDGIHYFSNESIDILHIDGLHTYEAVRNDFYTWLPKLAPGAVVMFHDTNVRERNFGVWRLWEELQEIYLNNFEFLHSNGLGVLQLDNGPSNKKLTWLQPQSQEKQQLIKYFADLGSLQLDRLKLKELDDLKQHAINLDLVVVEREAQIAKFKQVVLERDGLDEKINQVMAGLDQEIAALRNSTSWRVTSPLRVISRLLAGNRRRAPQVNAGGIRHTLSQLIRRIYQKLTVDISKLPEKFDPDVYLKLNPDLAESGLDPAAHYLRHGCNEGRIYSIPLIDIFEDNSFNVDRDTILLVSHEASRTGAPVLSLNLAQSFVGPYNVVVLLLSGGALTDAFRLAGVAVITLSDLRGNPILADLIIGQLCGRFKFKFALVNSIESRLVLPILAGYFVPTISLIHEFASYTRPRNAFRDALFWSGEVVFSANVTMENAFAEYPDLVDRSAHILPQGRCLLPLAEFSEEQRQAESTHIRRLIRPKGISEDAVIVLGAGFVQLRKGVDLFIECAARVLRAPGGDRCRFVWIGKGYDPENDVGYSVYLADQIRRAGLQEHVLFIDETTAIETAYEEADLLLLSSRLDPLPNVAIDAMGHGVPVLCFNKTTGIADFLINCGLRNHCVAEYLDSADMAEKILALAGSQALREDVVVRCREASIAYFSMKEYVARLEVLAQGVGDRTKQEKLDTQLILGSGLFRSDFASPPNCQGQLIERQVHGFARGWASGIGRRKPFPGFHPGIYLEQHGIAISGTDPFADYLRAGRPEGPWNYPVIVSSEIKEKDLPANPRVALHLHVYYSELLPEIMMRLSRNRICPDLFISIADEKLRNMVLDQLKVYQGNVVDIQLVPNRGRDIGPFLTAFPKQILSDYDFVGHIHTKKTADLKDASVGSVWFKFLLENLLGGEFSGAMADSILTKMNADPSIGLVFPDDPNIVGWSANRAFADEYALRLGLQNLPEHFIFPIGTMFWARTSALVPMMNLNLGWDDYPEEPLPYDGTSLHAIERLFPLSLSLGNLRCATTNVIGLTR